MQCSLCMCDNGARILCVHKPPLTKRNRRRHVFSPLQFSLEKSNNHVTNGWPILQQGTDLLKGKRHGKKPKEEHIAILPLKGKSMERDLGEDVHFSSER
jgi:hypothetical protein